MHIRTKRLPFGCRLHPLQRYGSNLPRKRIWLGKFGIHTGSDCMGNLRCIWQRRGCNSLRCPKHLIPSGLFGFCGTLHALRNGGELLPRHIRRHWRIKPRFIRVHVRGGW